MRRWVQILGWTLVWSGLFGIGLIGWQLFGTDVVNGRVQAKTVHLNKIARVTADMTHETLTIEAGAYFEGQVQPLNGASSGSPAASTKKDRI